ncbi:hypothetical protein SADUNF_Sadunf02G0039100 [Salix dunnii]|uniref:ENT domain-containing protein n=1 Tax=Salix dunnii TaxID=1413687 RepID=A0A835TFG5_9ROSI|nr:hypothetical protein SADUNF_Sadunf02G0039100 [Salix dunnii]
MVMSLSPTKLCLCSFAIVIPRSALIKSEENWSDVQYNMMAFKFLKHEFFAVIPPKFDEYILYCQRFGDSYVRVSIEYRLLFIDEQNLNDAFFGLEDSTSSEILRVDEKLEGSSEMNAKVLKATTEWLFTSSSPLLTEDSNPSSVASCSPNGFVDSSSHRFQKPLDNTSHNSDAESSFLSFPVIKRLTPCFEQMQDAEIHELEFHAYRSTVQALYASGPSSWDQESLLTNLRLSLNISDEELLPLEFFFCRSSLDNSGTGS